MEPDAHLSPAVPLILPEGYPTSLDREERLTDGALVHVRPIVPPDIERMRHAFEVGDADSIRRRFLTGAPPSDESHLHYLVDIDYRRRLAVVALDANGNSIGLADTKARRISLRPRSRSLSHPSGGIEVSGPFCSTCWRVPRQK